MTLRQLEVFLAVARAKSFSLAAKKIHSSQPTLSEHISELETELGKQLFFRRGRRRVVTVTEAGRVFAEFAERAISAIEGGRQALADLDGLTHGSLLIGASTTPGLYVLPRIVAAFRTKYPGVDVKLQIANSQTIEGRVRERELDLGIVGGHALRPGEECLTAGMRDELVLIVSPAHAWARRRDVTPEALADRAATRARGRVCDPERHGTRATTCQVSRGDGARPHRSDQAGRDGWAGRCICLTYAVQRRNGRGPASCRPAARRSHSATFPRHSPRGPESHGECTRLHGVIRADGTPEEEGIRLLERDRSSAGTSRPSTSTTSRSLKSTRYHLPIGRHPDLSVTILVLVWQST